MLTICRKKLFPVRPKSSSFRRNLEPVRLQKYLAECGIASRRKAEELIESGKVRVNGMTARLGASVHPGVDRVDVRGKPVFPEHKGIILLNKPVGVITSKSDPEGRRTVMEFLTKKYRSYFPVGRLDYDTSGLLILTNDGELAEVLMHPRYEFRRVYLAEVRGHFPEEVGDKIYRGIQLDDGRARADILIKANYEDSTLLEVVVEEGRNRMVRRIFDRVGFPVKKLKRVVHGPFKLGGLKTGEIKKLSEAEYQRFRSQVLRSAERN
jgi:23S rRNA pseudouridine2605 synthase